MNFIDLDQGVAPFVKIKEFTKNSESVLFHDGDVKQFMEMASLVQASVIFYHGKSLRELVVEALKSAGTDREVSDLGIKNLLRAAHIVISNKNQEVSEIILSEQTSDFDAVRNYSLFIYLQDKFLFSEERKSIEWIDVFKENLNSILKEMFERDFYWN